MDKAETKFSLKDPKRLFRQFLSDRGLRCTAERIAILDCVQKNHDHFEAKQILQNLRRDRKKVSKASVYRTVALLTEAGILRQVLYGEKHAHYEHEYDQVHHDHLVCRQCGRIIEFKNAALEKIQSRVCRRHNFFPEGHRLQIHGLCSECVNR